MSVLLILNDPPYGTERSYNALRLAHALLKRDPAEKMTVFLLGDAVACAKTGQSTPDGYYNLERMVKRVVLAQGDVLLCGTCLDARGIGAAEVIEGARRSTMAKLADATAEADRVLVF